MRPRYILWIFVLLTSTSCAPRPVEVIGEWGGEHIALTVEASGAWLEFDCATGEITEPLTLDSVGRFDVAGLYSPDQGGPVQEGEEPVRLPARYVGSVIGYAMMLSVTLTERAEVVGPFQLRKGALLQAYKCL